MSMPKTPPAKEPSDKQRTAHGLRKAGNTWEAIGQLMGVSAQVARSHCKAGEIHGLERLPTEKYTRRVAAGSAHEKSLSTELGVFDPKDGTFDLEKFIEMAMSTGTPVRMAQAIGRRIQLNYGPVREEMKRLMSTKERVEATYAAAEKALGYIDDLSITGMNAKDLATTYGILVDKALVMGGKPNVIVDFNARRKLEALMPEMMAEAKRRGITIDGTATIVQEKVVGE